TVGTTLDGTLGLVVGDGFQLGLFNEFEPQGTPVPLSQVKAAIGTGGLERAGNDGTGIDVALIDTGVVPVAGLDRGDVVAHGPDLSFDQQAGLAPGLDGYGHGTHLAGIIANREAGSNGGIAPASRLLNLKVGASNGAVDVSQVIAAIDWVVQHRSADGLNVRVLNLSYGTDGVQPYELDPLTHAIESAWRNGIVVVVAAGNTGGSLTNPATDPFVITVGAADLKDPKKPGDDVVADYSAIGSATRRVDVVAPGTSIVSLRDPGSTVDRENPSARVGDRHFRGSGTSQAAAVTSGAIADLLEARPTLAPDQVKALLKATARPLPRSTASSQGAGMIDLAAAWKANLPSRTTQDLAASTGKGSLERARGSVHVSLDGRELRGEIDVQSAPWTPDVWAPLSSAGTAWSGGTWNGNVWAGAGYQDGSAAFTGRTWKSATWTGRTWKGDTWTGRTWKGDSWTGRTWKSA
ncbi:MAG: S8 family serine peptidase, partial [Acidimicrobiales bacterium]|nr:S8 family serine peptidase [Acidimicrobiales bacterium]